MTQYLPVRSLCMAVALLVTTCALSQPYGYTHAKEITVQESQISGTAGFNNFPLLYSVVDPDLRSTANGGFVHHTSGYDIMFYQSGCAVKLDHQVERYNPATGELVAWVRIPYLSATANTSLQIYYGNDTVTINPSTTATWNSNYNGVWHLNENPAGVSPQMTDYTGNGHNGISNGGMTAANSVTGKFANGVSFDEVNDYIRIPDFLYGQELTVSFWFNLSEVNGTGYQYIFSHGVFSNNCNLNVYVGEDAISPPAEVPNRNMVKTNYRDINDANNFDTLDAGNTLVDGNWHMYTIKIQDEGGATVYIDGVPVVNYSIWGENTFDPINSIYLGARQDLQVTRFYGGYLDEVRISSVWHTHEWIEAEFRNLNSPSTFYTVSADAPSISYCSVLEGNQLKLNWEKQADKVKFQALAGNVESESIFSIERSSDMQQWATVHTKQIAVAHQGVVSYPFSDKQYPDKTYYRAVIQKSNGKKFYSPIEAVESSPVKDLVVFPNPVRDNILRVKVPTTMKGVTLTLFSSTGKQVMQKKTNGEQDLKLALPSNLAPGVYVLRSDVNGKTNTQKIIIQ